MKMIASGGKKVVAVSLALILGLGGLVGAGTLHAEEEIPLLTKEMFIQEVLTDNSTLIDLEEQLEDLEKQKEDLDSILSGLSQVYDLVGRYNALGGKYLETRSDDTHFRYLSLQARLAGVPVPPADDAEAAAIQAEIGTLAASIDPEELAKIMSLPEYLEYLALGDVLRSFGVEDKVLTPDDEYELFIEPIYVGYRSLDSGIASLKDGIISAANAMETGAGQLYDTVVMLEEIEELLELSYDTSVTNYDHAKTKYEKGLLTVIDVNVSYNNMESAKLSVDQMERDIDSLKMNMNLMMGRPVAGTFRVVDALKAETDDEVTDVPEGAVNAETADGTESADDAVDDGVFKLKNVRWYVDEALKQRSEIISLNRSLDDTGYKFIFLRNEFGTKDRRYVYEKKKKELIELELEDMSNHITIEVREAYNDVKEKKLALELTGMKLEDANRQYKELAITVEQGFVTASTLDAMNAMLVAAANDADEAARDYNMAVETLLEASSF